MSLPGGKRPLSRVGDALLDHAGEFSAWSVLSLLRLLWDTWQVVEVDRGHRLQALRAASAPVGAFFHRYAFAFGAFPPTPRPAMMLSPHRHGRFVAAGARRLGVTVIHGSPNRQPRAALRASVEAVEAGHQLLVAVDGSRGPAGYVKPGVALLAQRTGSAIVPLGVAATRTFVIRRSWDQHVAVLPYSRVFYVYGEPIEPCRGLAGLRDEVQLRLDAVQAYADRLANDGPV